MQAVHDGFVWVVHGSTWHSSRFKISRDANATDTESEFQPNYFHGRLQVAPRPGVRQWRRAKAAASLQAELELLNGPAVSTMFSSDGTQARVSVAWA